MSCIYDFCLPKLHECQKTYMSFSHSKILKVFKPPESAKCTAFTGERSQTPFPLFLKHSKGLAEQFKAEKRMLLFLYNSFGVHFYLFEKGEIPLETPQIPFCLPVNWLLVFTQRGGHVMLLLMEKWHKFKLLSSWWPFPTDTLKVCRRKCRAESVCIHIQPVLRNRGGDEHIIAWQFISSMSATDKALPFNQFTTWKKTFFLSHPHSNLITYYHIFNYYIIFLYFNKGFSLKFYLWTFAFYKVISFFFFFFTVIEAFHFLCSIWVNMSFWAATLLYYQVRESTDCGLQPGKDDFMCRIRHKSENITHN